MPWRSPLECPYEDCRWNENNLCRNYNEECLNGLNKKDYQLT